MNSWEEEFKEKFLTNKSYYQSKNGIVYWSELLEHIHSLLKQQREIMIKLWLDNLSTTYEDMLTKFNNAPEPSEEKLK